MSKEPTKEELKETLAAKEKEAEDLKKTIAGLNLAEAKAGKLTIEQLEALLDRDEEEAIQILPNGEIRPVDKNNERISGTRKPITLRENLGGEYGQVA